MSSKKLVSIVINNYNYDRFLSQAIESALNQTYKYIEVIVVDDGSTDNSSKIISSYGDQVIPILKENGGQASAINAGFNASSGEIICLLDSDDIFLPEKAKYIVDLFNRDQNVNWVFTESLPFNTEEIEQNKLTSIFESIRNVCQDENPKKIDYRNEVMLGKIPNFTPSTSNLSFSRDLLSRILPLPEIKGLSGMAITDLYFKIIAVGLSAGYSSSKNLGVYRMHNNAYGGTSLDKKRRMFGEIYTTTGYWMNKNFPAFKRISLKLLSKGFATSLRSKYLPYKSADADCTEMLTSHLKCSSTKEKLEVFLFVLYYWMRLRKRDLV